MSIVPKLSRNCVSANYEFASNLKCVKIVYCSTTNQFMSAFGSGNYQHYEIKDFMYPGATLTSCTWIISNFCQKFTSLQTLVVKYHECE